MEDLLVKKLLNLIRMLNIQTKFFEWYFLKIHIGGALYTAMEETKELGKKKLNNFHFAWLNQKLYVKIFIWWLDVFECISIEIFLSRNLTLLIIRAQSLKLSRQWEFTTQFWLLMMIAKLSDLQYFFCYGKISKGKINASDNVMLAVNKLYRKTSKDIPLSELSRIFTLTLFVVVDY